MKSTMKKIYVLAALFLLTGTLLIHAHEEAVAEEQTLFFDSESEYYRVRSYISEEHAQNIGEQLDTYLEFFNSYFHFNLEDLGYKLKARIFNSQAEYDTYLSAAIDETREEFVYLHNSDPSRSELVGAVEDDADLAQDFTHQAFVQFIRALTNNPPLWLQEGFAVYFEEVIYVSGNLEDGNTLAWLETLKSILMGDRSDEALSPERLLSISLEAARENIEVFYPQSWALVYYLINTEHNLHNRILWDSITAMNSEVPLEENSRMVYERVFQWVDMDVFVNSFMEYFDALKTYSNLVEDGIAAYELGNLDGAAENLLQAVARRDDSHIPYYYLGLINYDQGNYGSAAAYYQEAMNRGQKDALIYYALGLNAFADNQYEQAREYLSTTLELDSESFSEKVDRVQERMDDQRDLL